MSDHARCEIAVAHALLLVDVQQGLFDGPHAIPFAGEILAAIRSACDRARAADALVVHIQNDGDRGAADEPGSHSWALVLAPEEGEAVLRKRSDDAFEDGHLSDLLRRRGCSVVAIGGALSEMCVSATARGALREGFGVVLVHDSHGTHDIPAVAGIGEAVPANVVARVAEWALGDQVRVVATADDVSFSRP